MISSILLTDEKQNVVHKKRFLDDFSGDHISFSQKKSKPEDFEKTFEGNIDDDFKIGIAVTKKSLKVSIIYSTTLTVVKKTIKFCSLNLKSEKSFREIFRN